MSKENVEIVRRAYEAWNRRDFDAAAELLSPDIEWQMPSSFPEPDTWRSSEDVRRGLARFHESWGEFRAEVQEYIDAGDRVVALVRFHGRAAITGVAVEGTSVDATVWTLRDGQAIKVQMYIGTSEALETVAPRGPPPGA
jgi:ketosteroid isomerase-like protein